MIIDLYQFSLSQLAQRQGSWADIARECDVSYSWLCKLAHGKIPGASYVRVHRIASHINNLLPLDERADASHATTCQPLPQGPST